MPAACTFGAGDAPHLPYGWAQQCAKRVRVNFSTWILWWLLIYSSPALFGPLPLRYRQQTPQLFLLRRFRAERMVDAGLSGKSRLKI